MPIVISINVGHLFGSSCLCMSYDIDKSRQKESYYDKIMIKELLIVFFPHHLEYEKLVRSLYNSLINNAETNTDIDRSLCEILLQLLTDSVGILDKTPSDAFRLVNRI